MELTAMPWDRFIVVAVIGFAFGCGLPFIFCHHTQRLEMTVSATIFAYLAMKLYVFG